MSSLPCRRAALLLILLALLSGMLPSGRAYASILGTRLQETDGVGDLSLPDFVFFGESTTAHLSRSGGVLDTPAGRMQVLRDGSGTRMLDRRILASPVVLYGADGSCETVSFSDAVARLRPKNLVLSFGLNGIMGFLASPERFDAAYGLLIDGIRQVSPETRILLQSVYPVRASDGFSVDTPTLNAHIRSLNERIQAIASQRGVVYLDSASVLRDADGALRADYDSGDGIHLTNDAYRALLAYFRTWA